MSLFGVAMRESQQYGLLPRKLLRLLRPSPPPVLANSLPKSGTNLLTRALYLHPGYARKIAPTLNNGAIENIEQALKKIGSGRFRPAHLYYDVRLAEFMRNEGLRHVFMVRDPRDVVVSNARYLAQDRRHRLHRYFSQVLDDEGRRIMACIQGVPGNFLEDGRPSMGIGYHLRRYAGWLDDVATFVVSFEALIGPAGGGSKSKQLATLASMFEFVGAPTDEEAIAEISANLFSTSSRTFNKGQIGGWRSALCSEHEAALEAEAGDLLPKYTRWTEVG